MSERIPYADMAEEMGRALRACERWLEDHSGKRPDWEVALKRRRREAFAQAVDDYTRGAARQEKSA